MFARLKAGVQFGIPTGRRRSHDKGSKTDPNADSLDVEDPSIVRNT